jgi:hypothetical protein
MHYGDKKHQKAQKIIVTTYKDEFIDCDNKQTEKEYCIRIESIVEARHVSTYSMCELHFKIEHILKDVINDMKCDIFYVVELKTDGWKWKVVKIKELTTKMIDNNPLLGLH